MGILSEGKVGEASASLVGASELNSALEIMLNKGITIYDVEIQRPKSE